MHTIVYGPQGQCIAKVIVVVTFWQDYPSWTPFYDQSSIVKLNQNTSHANNSDLSSPLFISSLIMHIYHYAYLPRAYNASGAPTNYDPISYHRHAHNAPIVVDNKVHSIGR